jgi:hypothetical protein
MTFTMEVMDGSRTIEDVPHMWREAVRSSLQHPVWEIANAIMAHPSAEKRTKAMGKVPDSIRPLVQEQAMKIFERRRLTTVK